MQWPSNLQPTHARWERVDDYEDNLAEAMTEKVTLLPKLDAVYARNFRIHDVILETAPDSILGNPGVGHDESDLKSIPSHILDELPQDCRAAFQQAQKREVEWKTRWQTEAKDGRRACFTATTAWVP